MHILLHFQFVCVPFAGRRVGPLLLNASLRVTTCLANLENIEMSGILLKVWEMSGKKSCQRKVA